jgi:hypothetical protein
VAHTLKFQILAMAFVMATQMRVVEKFAVRSVVEKLPRAILKNMCLLSNPQQQWRASLEQDVSF